MFDAARFETLLTSWLAGAQKIVTDYYTEQGYGTRVNLPIPQLSLERGKRYIRIVRTDTSRSVHCFIDTTNGDVLMAAGWKAPAKHARGNIFDEKNGLGSMGVYGAAYIKRGW